MENNTIRLNISITAHTKHSFKEALLSIIDTLCEEEKVKDHDAYLISVDKEDEDLQTFVTYVFTQDLSSYDDMVVESEKNRNLTQCQSTPWLVRF